jgi:hypothetical protein
MLPERMGRSTAVIYLNFETNMLTNLIKDIPTMYVSNGTGAIMMKFTALHATSYPFHWNDWSSILTLRPA